MDRRHCRGGVILIVVAVIVIGGIAVGFLTTKDRTVVKPDETACDCPDIQLMLNRRRLAEAAIKSIDSLTKTQSAQEMYSDKLYEQGRRANDAAVYNARQGDEQTGSATTHHTNCKPDVSQGRSACMQASLQAHENVHQRECLKYNSRLRNYKYAKTMVDFWTEDRDGYQAEVDYLDRQIARVVKKCMQVTSYPGAESKEEQQQRLAGSKRRVTQYVAGLS